ncbi:hypothetical protein ElyMa_000475100 [Elysia marginata]|uniref:Uncharacterized protein n=1 Tax=Elysia marginata TaxID=1093978 RepID=A0AAV4FSG8_9GAST|nr:hypothetical protein ElyMa_000475100 [Elysia marginata]
MPTSASAVPMTSLSKGQGDHTQGRRFRLASGLGLEMTRSDRTVLRIDGLLKVQLMVMYQHRVEEELFRSCQYSIVGNRLCGCCMICLALRDVEDLVSPGAGIPGVEVVLVCMACWGELSVLVRVLKVSNVSIPC